MEIPYIVTPRKDTGLFNSKIAIWLFLASEVMLFGGFFSAYIFLRIYADFPWPERTLPVLPGLINTFVLIASSVTVVFAWASLKMRQFGKFRIYMGITVACAVLFMGLKALEYNVKFHHQGVRLKDYTIIEGHLAKEKDGEGKLVTNYKGHHVEHNRIVVLTKEISFSTLRYHAPWVKEMLSQADHHKARIVLAEKIEVVTGITEKGPQTKTVAEAGEPLSLELLERVKALHLDARAHNSELRIEALSAAWKQQKEANPETPDWKLAEQINIETDELKQRTLGTIAAVKFTVDPPVHFEFAPRDIKEGAASSRLRDDTVVTGELMASPMVFEDVDAIDFQHVAMRAVAKGEDPMVAIENSWLLKNSPEAKAAWEWNKAQVAKIEKRLEERYGYGKDGKPKREPTETERYRIGWKDFVAKADGVDRRAQSIRIKEEFMGPDYKARSAKDTFPHLEVPRDLVAHAAKFTPSWNNYYAIYFTITGLHGLHVIGGALVLAYYLFFTRRMFETDPEWLANRVEVAGLFWHFVDLVWIFAFPIFYLM